MSIDLRPLSLGEILDRAFTLYRRHFVTFVGIMAVPAAVSLLISLPLQFYAPEPPKPGQMPDLRALLPYLSAAFGVGVVVLLVAWGAQMMALGAATLGVADLHAGRVPTIESTFARIRPRLFGLLLLWIHMMIRFLGTAFIGLLLGSLPFGLLLVAQGERARIVAAVIGVLALFLGILGTFLAVFYLMLRYAVAAPVLVIEGLTARQTLARSWALTSGYLGRVFVLTLFSFVLSMAAMTVFQMPFMIGAGMAGPQTSAGFWLQFTGTISGAVGGTLVSPVLVIAAVVFYYDLRVRKEAFDLQVLLGALDGDASGSGVGPGASPGAGLYPRTPPPPGLPG